MGIGAVNCFELPFIRTILLVASSINITYFNHYLIRGGGGFRLLVSRKT